MGVTMWVGEGQIQLHQARCLVDVRWGVINNSGIVKKINLLEPIKIYNIVGGLNFEVVGAESQFCRKFWSRKYAGNMSQSILV